MTESPAYFEHLLQAPDVCINCLRVIRVERVDPARNGLTREFESHYERNQKTTEIGYGPARSASEAKGVFCDHCGTEGPSHRFWDDHRTDAHELATALGWLTDVDEPATTPCQERAVSPAKFRELLKATIRTLDEKGVTHHRETLAQEALRHRRDGAHVDDCLGEATEAAIRRAVTREDAADADQVRGELPA